MTTPPTNDLPSRAQLSRARSWLRAHRRGSAALALLAAVLVLRAALPLLLEAVAEWQGTEYLGRVVRIGDVDLGLLSGRLVVEDAAIGPLFEGEAPAELDPESAHFRSARIDVAWSWLALARGKLLLEGVEIDSTNLLAVRGLDGKLVPLLRPRPEEEPEEDEDDDGEGWPIELVRLRVADLGLVFANLAEPARRPFEFHVEEFELGDLVVAGRNASLGAIGLSGPTVRVLRDIDLAPFFGGGTPAAAAPEPVVEPAQPAAGSAEPKPELAAPVVAEAVLETGSYHLQEVTLERARFVLVTPEREIETRLSLRARDLSLDADARAPIEIDVEIEEGTLSLRGALGITPPAFDGKLAWSKLPLASLSEAAGEELPLRISAGTSSGELDLKLRMAPGSSRIDLAGRAAVDGFAASQGGDALALSWSGLELVASGVSLRPDGENGEAVPPRVELSSVRLREPALRVALAERAPAEDAPAASEPAAGADAAPPPVVRVASLEISGGSADFSDAGVEPAVHTKLRELTLSGRDLRFPERDAASLSLTARGAGKARIALDAALSDGRGRVSFDLSEWLLTPFSPYAADGAGYWIEKGRATVRGSVDLRERGYDVNGDVKLVKLNVSELEPGTFEKMFGVPLNLALALLRDPRGGISLPVDVKLDDGGSDVGLGKVVVSALRQALLGALAAPLKGVGLLLSLGSGKGGLVLEPVSAAPGADQPDLGDLEGYARMLEERPELALSLHGRVGEADEPLLAQRVLAEQARADVELPPVEAGFFQKRRILDALEKRSRGEEGPLEAEDSEVLAGWIEQVVISKKRRRALAHARAAAVRDALVRDHGVDAERVEIGKPASGDPGVVVELTPAAD